jgi:hypothetical protein
MTTTTNNDTDTETEAKQLIAESIRYSKIAMADYSGDLADELLVRSEDSVQNGTETEYWGTTDDGDEWRVHLVGDVDVDDLAGA